jgi:hypothetical protein
LSKSQTSTSKLRPLVYSDNILRSHLELLLRKLPLNNERPSVNNGYNFWVPRLVVVHRLTVVSNYPLFFILLYVLHCHNRETRFKPSSTFFMIWQFYFIFSCDNHKTQNDEWLWNPVLIFFPFSNFEPKSFSIKTSTNNFEKLFFY